MKTSKRFLHQKKQIEELESTISSQKRQIEFLTKENAHLKEDNNYLGEKLSDIYVSNRQLYSEYSNKIAEMNRVISGYDAAKKSFEFIRNEYERKVHVLIKQME